MSAASFRIYGSREEKSENVQRYLSQIKNRTEVLKNLTEELFRYSVVTSSQDLKPEHMDVVRALEESLLSFYAVMQEKGIQPEIELPEEPVIRELYRIGQTICRLLLRSDCAPCC